MADDVGGTLQRYFYWTLAFQKLTETSGSTQLYIVAYNPLSESIGPMKEFLLQQGIHFCPPTVKWENDESIKLLFETCGTFQTVGQNELRISRRSLEENDGVCIGSVFLMKTEANHPSENESLHVTIQIPNNGRTPIPSYEYELLQQPNSTTPDVNLTPTSNQPTSRLLNDSGFDSPANTPSSSRPVPYTHSELKDLKCTPPSSEEEFDGYAAPKPKNDEEELTKNDCYGLQC